MRVYLYLHVAVQTFVNNLVPVHQVSPVFCNMSRSFMYKVYVLSINGSFCLNIWPVLKEDIELCAYSKNIPARAAAQTGPGFHIYIFLKKSVKSECFHKTTRVYRLVFFSNELYSIFMRCQSAYSSESRSFRLPKKIACNQND